jgi:hypothetical protein
VKQEQPVQ